MMSESHWPRQLNYRKPRSRGHIINERVDPDNDQGRYLIECARLRNIKVSLLVRRLIAQICNDQLVPAILDDDAKQTKGRGDHGFKESA
jgi:hypothetical protein